MAPFTSCVHVPKKVSEVVRLMRGMVTLAGMVEPCQVVDGAMPCADLDGAVSVAHDAPSVVVRGEAGELGILPRAAFMSHMAGRYGYGRSLWGRQPVSALATWGVPAVTEATTIVEAASLMVDQDEQYRDLPVVGEDGEPIGVVRPVHVMRALAELTARRADLDELTGAASRSRFIEELERRVDALRPDTGALVVAFLDLDGLKPVNDLYGHTLGDALLRSVARRIRADAAEGDFLGRLGGDEFAVLASFDEADDVEAEARALEKGEALRSALVRPDPALPAGAESRASIGLAIGRSGVAAHALLKAADEAMYAAKSEGGDRVKLGAAMQGARRVLYTAGLDVVYQPIVEATSGRVLCVEALLRESTADGGAAFPASRVERVARAGSALALDRWVLARACADMVRWAESAPASMPRRVHVNLAPSSLLDPVLADALVSTIDASGLPRERVCLELSELAGVDDLMRAAPQLVAIADAGVALALDDMGATLGALRLVGSTLPIDCVKIDRSVVVGAARGQPFDAEMLALVTRLADLFALEVIAEGVETAEEQRAVADAGIGRIQGFLHSVPLAAAELAALLDRGERATRQS